jgi:hypothetical protein
VHVQRMGVLVQGVGQMRAQDVGDFERRSLLGAGVRVFRSMMGSWRGKEWRCQCVCLFFFLFISAPVLLCLGCGLFQRDSVLI